MGIPNHNSTVTCNFSLTALVLNSLRLFDADSPGCAPPVVLQAVQRQFGEAICDAVLTDCDGALAEAVQIMHVSHANSIVCIADIYGHVAVAMVCHV